jgi:hypothetical protein
MTTFVYLLDSREMAKNGVREGGEPCMVRSYGGYCMLSIQRMVLEQGRGGRVEGIKER